MNKKQLFLPLRLLCSFTGAFRTINLMYENGIHLEPKYLNILSKQIAQSPELLDQCFYEVIDMINRNEKVHITMFNLIINGCALAKDLDRAFSTFNECIRLNVEPNIDTFNNVINACSVRKHLAGAITLLDDAQSRGLTPTETTFQNLIFTAVSANSFEKSAQFLETAVVKYKYSPSLGLPLLRKALVLKSVPYVELCYKLITETSNATLPGNLQAEVTEFLANSKRLSQQRNHNNNKE